MCLTSIQIQPISWFFLDLAIILPLSHCILGIQVDQRNLRVQEVPGKKVKAKNVDEFVRRVSKS